jgi:hypothetical protein
MAGPSLVTCASCASFIKPEETTCPFCGAPHASDGRDAVRTPEPRSVTMYGLPPATPVSAEVYGTPPAPVYGLPPPRPMTGPFQGGPPPAPAYGLAPIGGTQTRVTLLVLIAIGIAIMGALAYYFSGG